MVNQILSIIFQSVAAPLFGACLEMMLGVKEGTMKKWVRVLLWTVPWVASSAFKVMIDTTAPVVLIWYVLSIYYVISWYEGSIWRKVAAFCFLLFANFIGEISIFFVPSMFGTDRMSMDFTQPDMMVGCFFAAMMTMAADMLVVTIWQRANKRTAVLRHPWLYVLLPLCLVAPMLQYTMDVTNRNGMVSTANLISMVATFVLSLLLIFILFNQAQKDTIEKELEQTQYRFEMEQQHYRGVEARREELAKIRHDYNNLLTSVRGLLKMGAYEQAQEALDNLLVRVGQTRECSYCGVPIVNALLSEKQEICDREGIMLSADLLFPEGVSVEPIDLCSVFSNLMDNAIRACTQLPPEQRHITLTAGMKGDYLVVRCENPAAKAPGPLPEGTGYGKRILRDIAQRWGGSFEAAYENGIYTATVILLGKK